MLGDLVAEFLASLVPGPQTDRGLLVTCLVTGVVGVAVPLACPYLTGSGTQWVPYLLATSILASSSALVVGTFCLFRRAAGVVWPLACVILGLTGYYAAWTV